MVEQRMIGAKIGARPIAPVRYSDHGSSDDA